MPILCSATVLERAMLSETVFLLRLKADDVAARAAPGQFVHVRCGDFSVLRRPISVCDTEGGVLSLAVEARGNGTRWLSGRLPGDKLDVLGPLGRGFDLSGREILLVGGGIGVFPLLFAAKAAGGRATAALGFRSRGAAVLTGEFARFCREVLISTDDGSAGERGPVTVPLKRLLETGRFDSVLACGPREMLKTAAMLAEEHGVRCQVSLEERMGCGVGACLVCACMTRKDGKEHISRVCRDGPVFDAREVCWEWPT